MPLRSPLLAIVLALAIPAVAAAADDAAGAAGDGASTRGATAAGTAATLGAGATAAGTAAAQRASGTAVGTAAAQGAGATAAGTSGAQGAGADVAGPVDAQYRSGQVVVRYASAHASAVGEDDTRTRVVKVAAGKSVDSVIRALKAKPGVVSATPNMVAHASGFIPPDPGNAHAPAGWQQLQWNFLPGSGVNAPDAWAHLMAVGRPGGAGVKVAVLDTGVAYSDRKPFKRSPDFSNGRFVAGYDFVDHDPYPNDENGHGTHVAGTIAERTGNGIGVTGLAYGVRLMPVRVLDKEGEGDSVAISSGIRWAADHGAKIINLSFEFGSGVTRQQIPDILAALRHARAKGALVVGASGNAAAATVAYPARSADVLSVGATTQHTCQADYSNDGQDLDVVAPGGGPDAPLEGDPACHPNDPVGGDIYQMTFATETSFRRFGLPSGYIGTSMAAPHVSATAALVVASGLLGPNPTPGQIEHRLERTAHDLGVPGKDAHYGWGLIDASAATDPAIPVQ